MKIQTKLYRSGQCHIKAGEIDFFITFKFKKPIKDQSELPKISIHVERPVLKVSISDVYLQEEE